VTVEVLPRVSDPTQRFLGSVIILIIYGINQDVFLINNVSKTGSKSAPIEMNVIVVEHVRDPILPDIGFDDGL
jgi:hypothetical protein